MHNRGLLWLCLLAPALLLLAAQGIRSQLTPFDLCRTGAIPGGNYNSETELYDWTCGNYNWSSRLGGIDSDGVSQYGKPTTEGGNSWIMECTADGVGNAAGRPSSQQPTSYEQGVCLHAGERIKMYSMADIALAIDNVKPQGGKVYLPEGLYHDAYCGRQPDGTPNGCPITKHDPTKQLRKWTVWGGRSLLGEAPDRDGPYEGKRTGTVLLADHGNDPAKGSNFKGNWGDGSTAFENITGGAGNYTGGHWAWFFGMKPEFQLCFWPAGGHGCVTTGNSAFNVYESVAVFPIGGRGDTSGVILENIDTPNTTASTPIRACIDNQLSTSGVCSGNMDVRCTDDSDVRTSELAGGCPGTLGTCIGYADAIERVLSTEDVGEGKLSTLVAEIATNQKNRYAGVASANGEQDLEVGAGVTTKAFYAEIAQVSATTCDSGNGRYVEFGQTGNNVFQKAALTDFPSYDITNQPGSFVVHKRRDLDNSVGKVADLTVMPANWSGRTSANNVDAECGVGGAATGNESGGIACDSVEKVNFSGGYGGAWENVVSWYGGGGAGNQFSEQDGDPSGQGGVVRNSLFAQGEGLLSDESGWYWEDNVVQDWAAAGSCIFKVGFGSTFGHTRTRILNSYAGDVYCFQRAAGGYLRDLQFVGTEAVGSLFNFEGGRNVVVDGVTGWGNVGRVVDFQVIPRSGSDGPFDEDMWNIRVANLTLEAHALSQTTAMQGLIVFSDGNGASPAGGYHGWLDIENFSVESAGQAGSAVVDQYCGVFFGGLTGDDSDAQNGSGRVVDDMRNHLRINKMDVAYWDIDGDSAAFPFCFGNTTAADQNPEDANVITDIWDPSIAGPFPSWTSYRVQNVPVIDQPYTSMTSEEAGDCGDLLPGVRVLVHDSDVRGACEDSDADGLMDPEAADNSGLLSICECTAAGTWTAL